MSELVGRYATAARERESVKFACEVCSEWSHIETIVFGLTGA